MGIGSSKLNPQREAVPTKLRPIIRRFFEQMRRRRHADMSKKELLKKEVVDDENSQAQSLQDKERKSTNSSLDGTVPITKETPKTPLLPEEDSKSNTSSLNETVPISKETPVEEKKLEVSPVPESEFERDTSKKPKEHKDEKYAKKSGKDCKDGKEEKEEDKVVEKTVVIEDKVVVVEQTMAGEEEEEDEEDENDKVRYVSPGSPSFRVYCVPYEDNNEEEGKEDSLYTKCLSGESAESAESVVSVTSDDAQETKTKKKTNRGRRFTKAIRRTGPVKNLLNVKSCYYPSCSGNERARLLAEKA
ncbi:uncharacterized protein LOC126704360 [Quercus robur]|uniref:uncharacterized protein LOC126704360 n=1 Tax=Quercus robur TaxID=38942 RepID=UPI002162A160|nr:uncharacterized protein LOC126704360 [Quercus robur]